MDGHVATMLLPYKCDLNPNELGEAKVKRLIRGHWHRSRLSSKPFMWTNRGWNM